MATTKISQLPSSATPLSGQETVVMNQNGSTVTTILSNIKAYTLDGFSGGGGSDVSGLSANWQTTSTTVRASSASWTSSATAVSVSSTKWNNVYTTVRSFSGDWTTPPAKRLDYLPTSGHLSAVDVSIGTIYEAIYPTIPGTYSLSTYDVNDFPIFVGPNNSKIDQDTGSWQISLSSGTIVTLSIDDEPVSHPIYANWAQSTVGAVLTVTNPSTPSSEYDGQLAFSTTQHYSDSSERVDVWVSAFAGSRWIPLTLVLDRVTGSYLRPYGNNGSLSAELVTDPEPI